jgi:hypothetical protein
VLAPQRVVKIPPLHMNADVSKCAELRGSIEIGKLHIYQHWNEKSRSSAGKRHRFEQVCHPNECSSMHSSLTADKLRVQDAGENVKVKALEREVEQLRAERAEHLAGKFSAFSLASSIERQPRL